MLSLPRELIIHISQFTPIIDISPPYTEKDYELMNSILNYMAPKDDHYPMWNLYATCKSFRWMIEIVCFRLCLDESIITTTINNVYHGLHYDIRYNDLDYYEYGKWISTEKCNKEIMKQNAIVKFLIEKADIDYVYMHYNY